MKTAEQVVTEVADFLNSFLSDHDEFVKHMSHVHYTLQQSFTRLCMAWLRYLATTDFYDLRNEASVKFAKSIKEQLDHAVVPLI